MRIRSAAIVLVVALVCAALTLAGCAVERGTAARRAPGVDTIATGSAVSLMQVGGQATFAGWSPDGRWILFVRSQVLTVGASAISRDTLPLAPAATFSTPGWSCHAAHTATRSWACARGRQRFQFVVWS